LAIRGPIGGDDGSLHTKLIRLAGLALADTLHLRSVEGIQLPTALALLLGADLIGASLRSILRAAARRLDTVAGTDETIAREWPGDAVAAPRASSLRRYTPCALL